ncbi:MAG: IS3 family transposase [Pseudomonadota bacterium]
MTVRIRTLFEASKERYGAPRIHAELVAQGLRITRKTVARIMKENGIHPPRRRWRIPQTTDSRHTLGIAPNLQGRDFRAEAPDRVWLADITYVPTGEGWLTLAAVKDRATREIVGPCRALFCSKRATGAFCPGQARTASQGSPSDSLRKGLAIDALRMALQNCRPVPGLICHSDRGVQYASGDYRKLLTAHGVQASMSGKGSCLDREYGVAAWPADPCLD